MIQQNISYVVEGWTSGPDGLHCRKESTVVQTLDGLIQALRYLATVQQHKCFTVSTRLVTIQDMLGAIDEIEQTPEGSPTEVQT